MILDIVTDDDWTQVYLDGFQYHSGHSIPDFVWAKLVVENITKVRRWYMDMEKYTVPVLLTPALISALEFELLEEVVAD